jgi:hypothetical protein
MSFEINRLRRADRIIGGGAIALFIFLFFFKWFGGSVSSPLNGLGSGTAASSLNGWHSFTNSRWIWLITIVVALGAVALVATRRELNSPVQPGVLIAGLGALSTLLILYRIVHHPHASVNFGAIHSSYGIKIGIWLGLIAAGIVTYGGYLAMQAEGTSLADVRDQASRAVSSATASATTAREGTAGEGAPQAPVAGGSAPATSPPTRTPTPPIPAPPTPAPPATPPPAGTTPPAVSPPIAPPPLPGSPPLPDPPPLPGSPPPGE